MTSRRRGAYIKNGALTKVCVCVSVCVGILAPPHLLSRARAELQYCSMEEEWEDVVVVLVVGEDVKASTGLSLHYPAP